MKLCSYTVKVLLPMNLPVKKYLITILRFHGDVLLVTPIIGAIKKTFPEAQIDLLVYKGTGDILKFDSRLQDIIEIEPTPKINIFSKIKRELMLWRTLKKNNYNYALFLTTQWRLTFIGRIMNDTFSAAVSDKKREHSFWRNSFSTLFPEAGVNHIIERNLQALGALGIETIESDKKLSLTIGLEVKNSISKLLESLVVTKRYCIIHACSRRKYKLWSQSKFADIASYLRSKGFEVILTSGPNKQEIKYVEKIQNLSPQVINLGGRTSLIELAALIKDSSLYIGLDSVASHIAAAVNTPSIVLFGPTNHLNWRPWSDNSEVIFRSCNEVDCEIHGMKEGKFRKCLCYISSERVIEVIDKVLEPVFIKRDKANGGT